MTVQIAEKIIYKGRSIPLYSEPLNSLLRKKSTKNLKFTMHRTSCRRGYVGTWEIESGRLFLKDLIAWVGRKEYGIEVLFPEENEKVFAWWFTGDLAIQTGQITTPIMSGIYGLNYENEILIKCEKGIVLAE
ncbi:MAG: hypothetical protein QM478_13530 [Flavobacteriaceae bacterium]